MPRVNRKPHPLFTWPSAPIIETLLRKAWEQPRKLWHLFGRGIAINNYLNRATNPKLHIGAGSDQPTGWLNTDLYPGRYGMVRLDATQTFPFSDETFHFIFSEHMIEHIPLRGARTMLSECHRTLRPKGWIRLATPNLTQVARLVLDRAEPDVTRFLGKMAHRYDPEAGDNLSTLMINDYFYGHGHRFIYNFQMLSSELAHAGFINIRQCSSGISAIPDLNGIDAHHHLVGQEANAYETLVIEAQKP